MNRTRLILVVSLIANVALMAVLAYRESQHFILDHEAGSFARFAGKLQAHADFGNGVRRLYRPTLAKSLNDREGFTQEREGDAEIWAWLFYDNWGEASRRSAECFTEAYNQRMRDYIAHPESYTPNGVAASPAGK